MVFAGWCVWASLVTFALFAWDKRAARRSARGKARRVPERRLLYWSALGGAPGALLAQHLLRHKTLKEPFRTRLWAIAAVQVTAVLVWTLRGLL